MNVVDVVVGALVLLALLRGYFRGFFRELFGLLALGAAVVAALTWGGQAADALIDVVPVPDVVREGIGFVGVFLLTNIAVNLVGFLLDRLATALLLGGVNRLAGALFGAAKAAAVAAVVLLFLHLFPPVQVVDEQIMTSKVGEPLITAASTILHFGMPPDAGEKN